MLFTKPTVSLVFSMCFFASVPPAWSAAAPATKFPILPRMANQSATNVSPANSTQKYFAESFCNATQKVIEQVTWDDALKYAQALASWQSNGSFQPAMDLYMGNDSRGQLGAVLRANIDGAVKVHDLSTWPKKQRLFVFCTEPQLWYFTHDGCRPNLLAYVLPHTGTYYACTQHNQYLVFCPDYYNYPSLSEALSITDALPAEDLLEASSLDFPFNRAETYFHESLHFADMQTPIRDYYGSGPPIYDPVNVALEAEWENTAGCLHIATAYVYAAAAIFAQQRYNLLDPPKPSKSFPRRNLSLHRRGRSEVWNYPELPDPDTPDNRIASNDFGIGPIAPMTQNSSEVSSSRQLVPGSSSLLKRMAWRPEFRCTPENGCTRSKAATIATTISGPLICFLVVGLCVLSFFL